jgi:hypothetical protein
MHYIGEYICHQNDINTLLSWDDGDVNVDDNVSVYVDGNENCNAIALMRKAAQKHVIQKYMLEVALIDQLIVANMTQRGSHRYVEAVVLNSWPLVVGS